MFLLAVMVTILLQPLRIWPPVSSEGRDLGSPVSAEQRDLQKKLSLQIDSYAISADDFGHALIELASRFELPLGVEWIRSQQTLEKVRLSWRGATVQQMLQDVVKNQPGYRLEFKRGVVHIYPVGTDSDPQDFLNLRVEKFEVRDQVVEIASHRLRDLVRLKLSPPSSSPVPRGMGYSQSTNPDDPKFSLVLEGASVRQILDELLMASDRKIWVVTYTSDETEALPGRRRTATLWNKSEVPDSEQPVWDLLRWDAAIPQALGR